MRMYNLLLLLSVLLKTCTGIDEVTSCGMPSKCLCTGDNRLVFCDGPGIQFLPRFGVERLQCKLLVIQNTEIRTL